MEVHIVVKGDTLWKIARQYGIPFEELKRVNAHLANPDYIVPGMKIFLPTKTSGGKQEYVKPPEKGKVPVKPTPKPPTSTHPKPSQPTPSQPKPTQPSHPKPSQPTQPKPTQPSHPKPSQPTQPKPTQPSHPKPSQPTHPKPTPPVQVPPPIPLPTPSLPAPPIPTPPVQVPQPMPLPTPSLPTPPIPTPPVQVPQPMPLPTPSLPTPSIPTPPVQVPQPMPPFIQHIHPMIGIPCGWMPIFDADCQPFMHSGQIQAMPQPPAFEPSAPLPLPTPSLPSTQFPMYEEECEESPIFSSQGPATITPPVVEGGWQLIESPEYLFEESPEIDLDLSAWCPPEQGYVPQAISPAMQQGFPLMPYMSYQQGCGCEGQYQQSPMMMMPIFCSHLCNCQPPMYPFPYQMMPTPYQGSNWYGSY